MTSDSLWISPKDLNPHRIVNSSDSLWISPKGLNPQRIVSYISSDSSWVQAKKTVTDSAMRRSYDKKTKNLFDHSLILCCS